MGAEGGRRRLPGGDRRPAGPEGLARIIHEGHVNNPGLPDHWPFSPAAGGCLVAGGNPAVSRRTGDVLSVPGRRPQGLLVSPHCSRVAFAKNAG